MIVGVLALVWWWSGLNNGAGTGIDGTSESQPTSTATDDDADRTESDSAEGSSLSPGQDTRLTVLIRGDRYEIVQGNRHVPATLEEIVELAREMPGDDDGIRVQITHDPTGVSGAQSDLERALGSAGLSRDQWQSVQQPVE